MYISPPQQQFWRMTLTKWEHDDAYLDYYKINRKLQNEKKNRRKILIINTFIDNTNIFLQMNALIVFLKEAGEDEFTISVVKEL